MEKQAEEPQLSVRPTVHVGITGHRILSPEVKERITRQLTEVLTEIKTATCELAEQLNATLPPGYLHGEPRLRLISPLAEGTDRLAAQQALQLGYLLQCPLPFSQSFYETTFSEEYGSHREFRELLSKAERVMEIKGANEQFTSQAYADVGSVMVNHADILVAVWDGTPNRYIAGTYATVRQALRRHIPVIIIDAATGHKDAPILFREDNHCNTNFKLAVNKCLQRLLFPQGETGKDLPLLPLPRSPKKHFFIWLNELETLLLRKSRPADAAAPRQKEEKLQAPPASRLWMERKQCFSRIVGDMAGHYRNLLFGRLIFPLLATVFLTLAINGPNLPFMGDCIQACGLDAFSVRVVFYVLQILCLVLSFVQVLLDRTAQYHRRFLCYRVMAELCRQTAFLYPMGFANVHFRHRSYRRPSGSDITAWYYRMLLREHGLPNSSFTHADLTHWLKWVKQQLLEAQLRYHNKRAERCSLLQSKLGRLSFCFFVAGMAATIGRSLLDGTGCNSADAAAWLTLLSTLALISPPTAVFFASISQSAGYPAHSTVSRNMGDFFYATTSEIDTLLQKPEGEIFYTDVLSICESIDLHCREELSDWQATIREKPLKWV